MPKHAGGFSAASSYSQEIVIKSALHDCWLRVSQGQPVFEVLVEAAELIRRSLRSRRVQIACRSSVDESIVPLAEAIWMQGEAESPGEEETADETACDELPARREMVPVNPVETVPPDQIVDLPLCDEEQTLGLITVEFVMAPDLSSLLLLERCAELVTPLLQFRCRISALDRSTGQLREIAAGTGIPLVEFDAQLRVTHWNSAAEKAFGWEASQVLGQRPPMIPAASWTNFHRTAVDVSYPHAMKTLEVDCVRRSGEFAWFSVAMLPKVALRRNSPETCCLWFDQTDRLESRQIDEFTQNYRRVLQQFGFRESEEVTLLRLLGGAVHGTAGEIWQFDEPTWRRVVSWCDPEGPLPALRQSVLHSAGWTITREQLDRLEREQILCLCGSEAPRPALQRRASDRQPPPGYLLVTVPAAHRSIALLVWGESIVNLSEGWHRALENFQFELRQQFMIHILQTRLKQEETLRRNCDPLPLGSIAEPEPSAEHTANHLADNPDQTLQLVHDVFAWERAGTPAMSHQPKA